MVTHTPTTHNGDSLCTRAILVWLSISTWSARKYDRTVTQQVNREHAASSDAGRYNKMLLPGDAASYKALVSLCGSIRDDHYTRSLAWSDTGWRCLPNTMYMDYMDWYRRRANDLSNAVDAFIADYPQLRAAAAKSLNGMFNDADYPSAIDLRQKFAIGLSYMPIPDNGDVRVSLGADVVASIEANVQSKITESINAAVTDCWQRLQDVTARIAERLQDKDAIFRDSLILNARETCNMLAKLNVTGDVGLERMRLAVDRQLTTYDAKSLRDDDRLRASVGDKAQRLLDSMRAIGVV